MQEEIWKDIPGYEGLYQVSNLGRVYSFPKKWDTGKGRIHSHKGKILKPGTSTPGYRQVLLYKNKEPKVISIHKLVTLVFLSHKANSRYIHIDHIDGDRLNNNLNNLQIVSSRDNTAKAQKRKSKYIGVTYMKDTGKWCARIENRGLRVYLGGYKCETKAHLAYQKALKKIIETV